jgi:hypothetical protein
MPALSPTVSIGHPACSLLPILTDPSHLSHVATSSMNTVSDIYLKSVRQETNKLKDVGCGDNEEREKLSYHS